MNTNLLGQPGAKIKDIKNVYSHAQALSQCSRFIKKNNLNEHVRADTAGSAEMISKNKKKDDAAITLLLVLKLMIRSNKRKILKMNRVI